MQNFRNLNVWVKAHGLTLAAYQATRRFPKDEQYALTSQIRRSAASVCANIAEGCGRGGRIEFSRFLRIAFGSASELEYHLILAADLCLLERERYESLDVGVREVKRMLSGLIRRVRASTDD